jgi:hypothetical protein
VEMKKFIPGLLTLFAACYFLWKGIETFGNHQESTFYATWAIVFMIINICIKKDI